MDSRSLSRQMNEMKADMDRNGYSPQCQEMILDLLLTAATAQSVHPALRLPTLLQNYPDRHTKRMVECFLRLAMGQAKVEENEYQPAYLLAVQTFFRMCLPEDMANRMMKEQGETILAVGINKIGVVFMFHLLQGREIFDEVHLPSFPWDGGAIMAVNKPAEDAQAKIDALLAEGDWDLDEGRKAKFREVLDLYTWKKGGSILDAIPEERRKGLVLLSGDGDEKPSEDVMTVKEFNERMGMPSKEDQAS